MTYTTKLVMPGHATDWEKKVSDAIRRSGLYLV
jgi:hypothetical protein